MCVFALHPKITLHFFTFHCCGRRSCPSRSNCYLLPLNSCSEPLLLRSHCVMCRKSERQIRRSSEQKLDKNSKNSKKPRQNWVENLQAAQRRNSRKINSATTPHTHTRSTHAALCYDDLSPLLPSMDDDMCHDMTWNDMTSCLDPISKSINLVLKC